jgi:hypothetical protein
MIVRGNIPWAPAVGVDVRSVSRRFTSQLELNGQDVR